MRKEIIVHESPKSPVSESVRLLRTNLAFLNGRKKNQVILMTSAAPGDGKSWVTANLAIAYAQAKPTVPINNNPPKPPLISPMIPPITPAI